MMTVPGMPMSGERLRIPSAELRALLRRVVPAATADIIDESPAVRSSSPGAAPCTTGRPRRPAAVQRARRGRRAGDHSGPDGGRADRGPGPRPGRRPPVQAVRGAASAGPEDVRRTRADGGADRQGAGDEPHRHLPRPGPGRERTSAPYGSRTSCWASETRLAERVGAAPSNLSTDLPAPVRFDVDGDGDELVLDLLLFSVEQLRYVVELKIGRFDPADVGQLGIYVAVVDDRLPPARGTDATRATSGELSHSHVTITLRRLSARPEHRGRQGHE